MTIRGFFEGLKKSIADRRDFHRKYLLKKATQRTVYGYHFHYYEIGPMMLTGIFIVVFFIFLIFYVTLKMG